MERMTHDDVERWLEILRQLAQTGAVDVAARDLALLERIWDTDGSIGVALAVPSRGRTTLGERWRFFWARQRRSAEAAFAAEDRAEQDGLLGERDAVEDPSGPTPIMGR